jgi:hypothetical protein
MIPTPTPFVNASRSPRFDARHKRHASLVPHLPVDYDWHDSRGHANAVVRNRLTETLQYDET